MIVTVEVTADGGVTVVIDTDGGESEAYSTDQVDDCLTRAAAEASRQWTALRAQPQAAT
ncbi:MAG: hypothetical protein ACRDQG_17840 [Pseudonocardiaceae bacterium]